MKQSIKQPCVYILANKPFGTLYVGVTSDIIKRIYEHRNGHGSVFTKKYDCKNLVYYNIFSTMEDAITEEKRIKAGNRQKKLEMIQAMNPEWQDLYSTITN